MFSVKKLNNIEGEVEKKESLEGLSFYNRSLNKCCLMDSQKF